jgi:hypothetical protein
MVHADNEPGTITFHSVHQGQVPQRVLPVHHLAEKISRESFQLAVGTVLERHPAHVIAKIELGIVFPAGKANIERPAHHTLEVTGNQRQFRFDEP